MFSRQTDVILLVVLLLCDLFASVENVRNNDVTQSRAERRLLRQQERRRDRERMRKLRAHQRNDEVRDEAEADVTSEFDFSDFNPFDEQPEVKQTYESREQRMRLRKAMEARER